MFQTERLILRSLTKEDATDLFAYSKDETVGKNAGWKPHESLDESKQILEEVFLDKEDVFGIIEKQSGRLIGTVGFMPDLTRTNDNARMLGYAIGRDYWGKGFMTEAVQALLSYGFLEKGYGIISVSHYSDNFRSQRVIEKCGFQFEGVQRQSELRYDGVLMDKKWYSLTAEEFCQTMK
ncbi:putative ribosomal N-acetyltransferase YdaF [Anaerotignum neopropionicum]|uniref:Putative ribosomal N-acetyltransferase YdaF n=1 Tax=Anaerotignum neopropionicum TaxID=36847 RepID=A0A136WD73_9FIRM|nr:GNAT family protein [Anaerotignum neopropionicum]KXL52289.1 putative ribosomal N-acetyltransferase YdaF [Anaerotignum neopropionicum]